MDDKNAQELNALEEAAFNDPVKFLNEQHAPRTWTMSTEDLARTAAVSPYEIMATSEERWGPEKASIATTAVREFVRGFAGMADSTVNGIMEDRAKEIIYRSPNMHQKDANRLIEDVMRSGSLAREIESYESSKTAHDNFTAGISNGLGSMISLALLGWATRSPAAIGVAAGLGEAYNAREEMVDRYIQEMGTAEGLSGQLGKYNALSTGYGVFAGFVEGSIGVERLAAGALNRYGRLAAMERLARQQGKFGRALAYKTGRQVVATGLEEGGEEFVQSVGQDVAVALTRDMWENPDIKKALIQAGYGAIIGSTSGGVMYNIGRKRAIDFIRRWNDENNAGLTESQIIQAADAALDDVAQPMVDEIATRTELRNQYGQAYEILKNRFRQQIESTGTTPWTDQNKSMEEYVDTLASTLSIPAVLQANGLNIPTAQFLEIADMVVQDNVLQLVPLNNAAELEDIIARQTNILAQQREAKKLGMGDDTARQAAEQRKAVAQKALRNLREEERIRKQIVQEKRKADKKRLGYDEIDQAKKDTKFLKNAGTLDSFKAKLEDGTTTEQAKNRLEAAFMNWIADKDKTLAEDLILYRGGMQKAVDLLTANAKAIYDTAKKYPGARLREDIANALRKLRHTNKDNFLLVTQALARDGHDVMPENILLWHWVFADPTTNNQFFTNYTTKLAENREQVADGQALFGQNVAPLSKKDLIMQALQDTDQAKAQLAESRGRKYEPLFDKNGAVKEPYLAAAIVSYQNQFAPRFMQGMPRLFQEQFDLANENARLDEIYPAYDGDTIEVDGRVRTVYNSEGERINESAEALRNFWRWFGDSKAVDGLGRPIVMYHGSYEKFEAFSKDTFGNNTGNLGMFGAGFYFTDEHFIGADYAGLNADREEDKGTLYTVYLKIDNPLVIDSTEDEEDYNEDFRGLIEAMRKAKLLGKNEGWDEYNSRFWDDDRLPQFVSDYAKKHGFDGVFGYYTSNFFIDMGDRRAEFVAFEPTQIKSVENLGYYNAQDPRMLYQIAYSGARVDYDRPSLKAIGTGEQNQAHGYGLYYALDPMIAEKYRQNFTSDYRHVTLYKGEEVDVLKEDTPYDQALSDLVRDYSSIKDTDMSVRKQKFIKKYEDEIASTKQYVKENEDRMKQETIRDSSRTMFDFYQKKIKHDEAMLDAFKNIDATQIKEKPWGQVHEVDIPENEELLDEQKMLIDQPKYVEDIIWKINKDLDLGIKDSGITGERIYQKISDKLGSDKAASELLDKYGIKGITYYGREDGRCFVIFNDESVKVLRKKFDELGNQLFSLDFTRPKLVVTHGISSYNLDKALELGGLPAPSLAIVRASDPRTEFGDIKLVGTADMIDPANPQNKVYDRDIWSQRVPQPEYKKVPSTKIRPLREKFDAVFTRVGETQKLNEIVYTLTERSRPEDAIGYFENSDAAQLYYIENVLGKKLEIPTYDVAEKIRPNLTLFATPDDWFIEEISKIDLNIDNSLVLKAKIMPVVMGLIERNDFEKKYGQHADKFKQKAIDYYTGENFNTSKMFELVEETKRYLREKGKREIDKLALFDKLKEYRLWEDPRYAQWARDQFKDVLGEPRVRVGGKLVEWNAENLVKAMTRGPTVGSEKAFPGVGQAIAAGATRFSNLEEIRQAGRRLKTIDEANSVTDKAGNAVTAFAEGLIDKFGEDYREDIYKATAKIAGLGTPTASNIENIISRAVDKSANLTNEEIASAKKMAQLIKDVTRSYFEAKPQRIVSFDEFVGAIVPTNPAYDESAQKLADRGLTVIRSDDVTEGMEELSSLREEVLFQGRRAKVRAVYDPELQTIILGKDWNELSLVHEFHHHYLKKTWDYFKQAQAGMRTVSKAWLDDTQRLFSMLEIDPNQKALTTVQQEKFAYMVEAYLTGLGVENQDNLAFQGFLHWIPEKYRSIMDLGYLDANGQIQNPMLDEESIAFFNKWFASPLVPSLPSAPDAQRIMNASDEDGEIIPSNQKVMNNREKEWGQDSEIQNKADAQLWRGIGENTPSDMRAALDGEKELMKVETNNMPDDRMLPTPPKQTLREKWFKTRQPDARELAADAARAYLAKNPEHARELAFADPETLAEFDAPVDQGMLIRAVMETVGKGSDEWYVLDNNLAMVKSMSGSTLSLSGDLSHQAYLDAKREIEMARELKAITNYAGTGRGAAEKWNGDIRAFAARRTAAILATEPNSEERKVAINAFLEEAKTKFSGNTTNAVLNQLDLTGYQTKDRQVFVKWAEKQIKSVSHARLDAKEQAELMKASVAAQLALQDIDSKELKDGKYVRAVQSSKDIRHWQFVKDKMKKAYIGRWGKFGIFWDNLFGSYAPSAMLMSANTLFFANVPSTALNTATIRLAALSIGDNKVDSKVQNGEIKRIKQIFNASGVNIAQMDKPTSPSTLHGEKYTNQEQKHWYNFTFDILGREDNVFRVPTFVDALARIATKNANGDAKKATALFNEYTKLNTTDDDAKIARKQALAVANMAVFTQDGIMASALNHIRSSLNTMSRGALGLEPKGFGLGNILAPFLKTGANITEMGLSATLALPRTAIAIAQNKLLGKEIPDIRRIALISDWINLAWMSVVIALLAAINSDDDDWYTEPYESGKRYDPNKPYDSVNFGGVWVKLDIFGPMAIPLRTALKVVKEWEKKKLAAVANGLMFGGMEALSDTPLVNQVTDSSLDYMARQPESYWTGFGYNQLNKLVPAQVKTSVRAGSRATGTTVDVGWAGKTLERKFHRNYGLDGERLTTNDIISIFTNRLKYKP